MRFLPVRKGLPVLLVAIVVVLLLVAGSLLGYYLLQSSKKTTLINNLNDKNYYFDTSTTNTRLEDRLKEANLSGFSKQITIDGDGGHPISWFLDIDGQKVTGFSYKVDSDKKLLEVRIYIGDQVPEGNILTEINRNYIPAMLHSAESLERDPSYKKASVLGFEIFDEIEKSGNFPIKER